VSGQPARRYLWFVRIEPGSRPFIRLHLSYPDEVGDYEDIRPLIEAPEEFRTACNVPILHLGWSSNGRHWVLFGLDQFNPLHHQAAEAFPAFLAALVKEATTTHNAQYLLDSMRRAYQRSS